MKSVAPRAREFLPIPVQGRELRERENPLLELARKKGWIVMEEQKAPLILIVQRIRLNFRNELVKLTTKGRTASEDDGRDGGQNPPSRLC